MLLSLESFFSVKAHVCCCCVQFSSVQFYFTKTLVNLQRVTYITKEKKFIKYKYIVKSDKIIW